MADMTYTDLPEIQPRAGRNSYPLSAAFIASPEEVQSLCGLLSGKIVAWADTANLTFLGLLLDYENSGTGVTDAADPDNPEGRVNEHGDDILNVPIAGTTPTVGDEVYCASNNWKTDFTKVATTNTKPIGWITRIRSAGVGDIRLYTPQEYILHS